MGRVLLQETEAVVNHPNFLLQNRCRFSVDKRRGYTGLKTIEEQLSEIEPSSSSSGHPRIDADVWRISSFAPHRIKTSRQSDNKEPSMRRQISLMTFRCFLFLSFALLSIFALSSTKLRHSGVFSCTPPLKPPSERLLCDIWRDCGKIYFLYHSFWFHNSLFSLFRFFFISDCRINFFVLFIGEFELEFPVIFQFRYCTPHEDYYVCYSAFKYTLFHIYSHNCFQSWSALNLGISQSVRMHERRTNIISGRVKKY